MKGFWVTLLEKHILHVGFLMLFQTFKECWNQIFLNTHLYSGVFIRNVFWSLMQSGQRDFSYGLIYYI